MMRLSIGLILFASGAAIGADEPTPEGVEFFEKKIRPLLVQHCYECHSEEAGEFEGGLSLESRSGWETGGDTGPAVVPGKPEESLLVRALKYDGDVQMPPVGKLPESVIADFTRWVAIGAPDPRTGKQAPARAGTKIDVEQGRNYWAFLPLERPAVPTAADSVWPENSADLFVLKRLEEEGVAPSASADKRRLIRRATLDVEGIPPLPEEVDAFVEDEQDDAYERLVDRLLASPRFGERWGRHWLDVARFAESFGFEHDYDRPYAYVYRDFVIEALNKDLPYDDFVRWQLAGDEMAPDDPLALMATGFLAAGVFPTQITANEVERTRYDALDDMLATTGSAMLGLSIGCARCHDHKFDPIPSRDYYRMLSTFTTTVRSEIEIDRNPDQTRREWDSWNGTRRQLEKSLSDYERNELAGWLQAWMRSADAPADRAADWVLLEPTEARSEGGATVTAQGDGSFLLSGANPDQDTLTFVAKTPMRNIRGLRIEALPDPSLPKNGPGRAGNGNFGLTSIRVEAASVDDPDAKRAIALTSARSTFDQKGHGIAGVLDANGGCWAVDPQFGRHQAAAFEFVEPVSSDGDVILTVTLVFHCNKQHTIGRPRLSVTSLSNAESLGKSPASPLLAKGMEEVGRGTSIGALSEDARRELLDWGRWYDPIWQQRHRELAAHLGKAPQPKLEKIMVASEGVTPIRWHSQGVDFFEKTYILKRGDTNLKDGEATQGFLQVLMRTEEQEKHWQIEKPKQSRSSLRRSAMAEWMTDVDKGAGALLARVIVNRLWQHHLGKGIVSTPNDFGVQGAEPTHPELLEWLSCEMLERGWRSKDLHRLILTSSTYRQSSNFDETKSSIDPENQLLWRWTPRRLEAEPIRDSLLAASGILDTSMFGPGTLDQGHRRRSIYFTVKRSQMTPILQLFDAPEALSSQGRRSETTVAPQALAFMNDPNVRSWAIVLGEALANDCEDDDAAIRLAYRRTLGRAPAESEREAAVSFLAKAEERHAASGEERTRELAFADLCQVLFGLNEFIYIE